MLFGHILYDDRQRISSSVALAAGTVVGAA
jgi:hypothetical protein